MSATLPASLPLPPDPYAAWKAMARHGGAGSSRCAGPAELVELLSVDEWRMIGAGFWPPGLSPAARARRREAQRPALQEAQRPKTADPQDAGQNVSDSSGRNGPIQAGIDADSEWLRARCVTQQMGISPRTLYRYCREACPALGRPLQIKRASRWPGGRECTLFSKLDLELITRSGLGFKARYQLPAERPPAAAFAEMTSVAQDVQVGKAG